jgi:hypothetical protein
MTFGECAAYLRGLERRDRMAWEQARMAGSAMGAKIKLPWDNERSAEALKVDKKEIERIREIAKKFEK